VASESGIFQEPRTLEEIGGRSEIVSVLDYDTFSELQFGVPKPDFGPQACRLSFPQAVRGATSVEDWHPLRVPAD
jgi:hypothetical protein